MRVLFVLFMILPAFGAFSQSAKDPSPRLLVLDTTMSMAPAFNSLVANFTNGYKLIGSEKEPGNRVIYTYTDGREGALRIEYKFEVENGKQKVIYQSITADLDVIIPIFNGLFKTNIATDIDHASMIGGPISYQNKSYQCSMQADDYRPGYWVMSFVK